jgi:hypothetical protein
MKTVEVVCTGCSWVIDVPRLSKESVCYWCFAELAELGEY